MTRFSYCFSYWYYETHYQYNECNKDRNSDESSSLLASPRFGEAWARRGRNRTHPSPLVVKMLQPTAQSGLCQPVQAPLARLATFTGAMVVGAGPPAFAPYTTGESLELRVVALAYRDGATVGIAACA